ncbi:asparaginyl-tRNA synthetase [Halteromyces radiatus]|uniref:asparaginyl-tRNA synthetase n=1 Tax=Halteromyces radiatus TaxID=101107 RepID=UPI00221FF183|nr:asparaginyl-tRNA synthetase [Halteromyces radiatus]KAI8082713.1 asparaginyl-tRNA synthetase [Halteromyces radiatus]
MFRCSLQGHRRLYSTKPLFPTKTIRTLLSEKPQPNVTIRGWIRSVRQQKQLSFATINDGSTLKGIQAILNDDQPIHKLSTGTCVELQGILATSPGKEQSMELQVNKVKILGECDSTYPLQKKRHTLEFMRTINHLRSRANTGSAVLRIRHAASEGLQKFFANQEFIQVNTPLLTSSDCEGGGEVFSVAPSDFFKKPVYLTVSGQLHAEIMATSMGRVYTFGPVFRAEESMTSRHLAEFWMAEAEMTFIDSLDQLLDVTEASIQQTTQHVMTTCQEDVAFFNQWIDKHLLDKLQKSVDKPFVRMTYTEAIDILQRSKKKFDFPTTWGSSLQSEHERYLVSDDCCGRPVFVTDYPKELKPFYMRDNLDGKTVGCFDLLIPGIGELVGGSMREERYDVLQYKMEMANMNCEDYQWYLDLRKYGSAPHGGYGIGFERLMLWLTGLDNVREVVPIPRWVGHCKY